jgi:alanyl-tRNA synthetase
VSSLNADEIRTHTALHILKGAVQLVIGAKWTASVYVEGKHGRLTVQFNRKPTNEEILKIEELANKKILENQPIEELEMDRSEAERIWGDKIYDLFPLPTNITRIKILHIKDWNVNACKATHCKTTGEVKSIKIEKIRFRPAKQLLEISFNIS